MYEDAQRHVKQGDFFGSEATIIDLLRQDIEKHGYQKQHSLAFKEKRDVLVSMQKMYAIVPRRLFILANW